MELTVLTFLCCFGNSESFKINRPEGSNSSRKNFNCAEGKWALLGREICYLHFPADCAFDLYFLSISYLNMCIKTLQDAQRIISEDCQICSKSPFFSKVSFPDCLLEQVATESSKSRGFSQPFGSCRIFHYSWIPKGFFVIQTHWLLG